MWADSKGFLYFETSAQSGDGINDMFQVLHNLCFRAVLSLNRSSFSRNISCVSSSVTLHVSDTFRQRRHDERKWRTEASSSDATRLHEGAGGGDTAAEECQGQLRETRSHAWRFKVRDQSEMQLLTGLICDNVLFSEMKSTKRSVVSPSSSTQTRASLPEVKKHSNFSSKLELVFSKRHDEDICSLLSLVLLYSTPLE